MNDSIKHSDDEVVCAVTYTWGQVKTFLKEHGGCATDSNAEALLAECGNGSIDTGKDNLFCDAYDEIEQCLYTSLTTASLPDKPWYDRPNGEWVYDHEEPADHHDADEDEAWYGTYCHVGIHGGNQCRCCNTCSQCGRHMCEACTVRCSTCGSVICSNDARETKDGEWECVECERRIILGYRQPSEIPRGRNQPEAWRRAEQHQTARQGTEEPWKWKRLRHAGRHHLL